jgi:hypothetical protein
MKTLARDTGGRAFVNTNGFTQVIASVVSDSSDFYTLSYTSENRKMDGLYRRVDVKLAGPKYTLAYRRGYYAEDLDLPGATRPSRAADAGPDDPLRPFMEFGMPQTEQVLYKCLIHPLEAAQEQPPTADVHAASKGQSRYALDFAVDLKDLRLQPTPDGLHKGNLNLTIIVYDRYGHTVSRKDHVVALNIKPNIYEIFQKTGVQLHDSIEVPKGQFWVRTGVYDQASHKVGTMEVPLNQVKPLQTATR